MNTLEKSDFATLYKLAIQKSRVRLAEKQEEEEQRQLQSVLCFIKTQKAEFKSLKDLRDLLVI